MNRNCDQRRVNPEILDGLPADDPEAIRSRRDLRWIDAVMGNYRWIAQQMRSEAYEKIRWIEFGSGDGGVARQFSEQECKSRPVTGIDLAPRPACWPREWEWHQGDLFEYLEDPNTDNRFEGAIASLFLHHFEDSRLEEIGRYLSAFRVIVLVEPVRRWLHHFQCYLARPLMNRVTHHDSHVSIDAGFRDDELAIRLGLSELDWRLTINRNWFGSYRLLATRKH